MALEQEETSFMPDSSSDDSEMNITERRGVINKPVSNSDSCMQCYF